MERNKAIGYSEQFVALIGIIIVRNDANVGPPLRRDSKSFEVEQVMIRVLDVEDEYRAVIGRKGSPERVDHTERVRALEDTRHVERAAEDGSIWPSERWLFDLQRRERRNDGQGDRVHRTARSRSDRLSKSR